jgi:hypothetical protein
MVRLLFALYATAVKHEIAQKQFRPKPHCPDIYSSPAFPGIAPREHLRLRTGSRFSETKVAGNFQSLNMACIQAGVEHCPI